MIAMIAKTWGWRGKYLILGSVYPGHSYPWNLIQLPPKGLIVEDEFSLTVIDQHNYRDNR